MGYRYWLIQGIKFMGDRLKEMTIVGIWVTKIIFDNFSGEFLWRCNLRPWEMFYISSYTYIGIYKECVYTRLASRLTMNLIITAGKLLLCDKNQSLLEKQLYDQIYICILRNAD